VTDGQTNEQTEMTYPAIKIGLHLSKLSWHGFFDTHAVERALAFCARGVMSFVRRARNLIVVATRGMQYQHQMFARSSLCVARDSDVRIMTNDADDVLLRADWTTRSSKSIQDHGHPSESRTYQAKS